MPTAVLPGQLLTATHRLQSFPRLRLSSPVVIWWRFGGDPSATALAGPATVHFAGETGG